MSFGPFNRLGAPYYPRHSENVWQTEVNQQVGKNSDGGKMQKISPGKTVEHKKCLVEKVLCAAVRKIGKFWKNWGFKFDLKSVFKNARGLILSVGLKRNHEKTLTPLPWRKGGAFLCEIFAGIKNFRVGIWKFGLARRGKIKFFGVARD